MRPQVDLGSYLREAHQERAGRVTLYRAESERRQDTGRGVGAGCGYLAPSSALPSPSVLPSSSVFRSSVLSFCSFFLLTHLTTISTKMTTAKKPPTEAPTMTATVESRSGGTGEKKQSHRAGEKMPCLPCSPKYEGL